MRLRLCVASLMDACSRFFALRRDVCGSRKGYYADVAVICGF